MLTFRLTVTDARGLTLDEDEVRITLSAGPNDAPTAEAGEDRSVSEGALVVLDGRGSSDPEGEALTYAWTQTAGPAVTLEDAGAAEATFTAPSQLVQEAVLAFELTVTDARGLASPADAVTITAVPGANDAPAADAGDDRTVAEGAAVALDGSASSDPEGEALTWDWRQTGGPQVSLEGAETSRSSFEAPVQLVADTVLTFSLRVTDARGAASELDEVRVTVEAGPNDPPAADAGPDQTVEERDRVTLTGTAADPEGEAVTFAWTRTAGPAVTLDGAATAAAAFTAPDQLVQDVVYTFALTATDARGAVSPADEVRVTVEAGPNDPPVADAGADQTVQEQDRVTLTGSASDPEGEALTFAWTQTGGPAVTLEDAASAIAAFTAPDQLVEDLVLTFAVTATDARGAVSEADELRITVEAGVNDPPVADAGPDQTVQEQDRVTLAGSASDPEGEALTFAWTQTGGLAVTLDGADTVAPAFMAPAQLIEDAVLTFGLTATDTRGRTSEADEVRVTVAAGVNDPPVLDAGADRTAQEGDRVTLTGSADDPEGEAVTFIWTQTGGPAVTLDGADSATAAFTAPEQLVEDLVLTFAVTATDARGAVSQDEARVTVEAGVNDPPAAAAGPDQTAQEGDPVTLTGSASDPEGEALTFAWNQTGGPAVTLDGADTATAAFTAPAQLVRDVVLTFAVTATDARGAASEAVEVRVTVEAGANDPPVAAAGPDQTVEEEAAVTLAGSADDPEGEALAFAWNQTGGPAVALEGAATATASFAAPGQLIEDLVLTFAFTATDARGASSRDEARVTVEAGVNDPPVFDAASYAFDLPENLDGSAAPAALGTVSAADPEGDAFTYALAGDPRFAVDPAAGRITYGGPGEDAEAVAVYSLSVTATDARGAAASAPVTIAIGNLDEPGAVSLSSAAPRVGHALSAALSDPDGGVTAEAWQWQSSADGITWTDLDGAAAADYTPAGADLGQRLRARATYSDAHGAAADPVASAATEPVAMDPQDQAQTVRHIVAAAVHSLVEGTLDVIDLGEEPGMARSHLTLGGRPVPLARAGWGRSLGDLFLQYVEVPRAEGPSSPGAGLSSAGGGFGSPGGGFRPRGGGPSPPGGGLRLRRPSLERLLSNSSFRLASRDETAAAAPRGVWALWGRGAMDGFQARPDDGEMEDLDGRGVSGYVGLDYRPAAVDLRVGLAVGRRHSEVDYTHRYLGPGDARFVLTTLLPYVRWSPRSGLALWTLFGAGRGEVELEVDGQQIPASVHGLSLRMASAGLRQDLLSVGPLGLAAKTDALGVEWRSEDASLDLEDKQARRLRLALEGRTDWALGEANTLSPRLQLGLRWDDGSIVRGLGTELAGGLTWMVVPSGLDIEARGRRMLVHQDASFTDWGASLLVRLEQADGRGLQVRMGPTWGSAASQVESLWDGDARPRRAGAGEDSFAPDRMALRCSYGWQLPAGRLAPFVQAEAGGHRSLRAGARLQGDERGRRQLELFGEQHGSPGGPPDRRLGFTGSLDW